MTATTSQLLFWIPALPLLGFLINGLLSLSHSLRKKSLGYAIPSFVACLMPTLAFGISLTLFFQLLQSESPQISSGALFTWIDSSILQIDFALYLDQLSAVMLLLVTGVGSLIHYYSIGYMKKDPSVGRYFAYLNLFLFFMLLLILGENLLVLFVGWEGVGLCSYLLIGFWFEDSQKAKAGKKAFIVNRVGDFAYLIGLFLIAVLFHQSGLVEGKNYFDFSVIAAHKDILLPSITAITLCLFIGATGKSAQIPLYVWLPDAMAGPTPVSALIHAATMVTAGIYMIARLFFLYEMAPMTLQIIASIGAATALMAAMIAVTQKDIKKVLAYSTVSQLGYMFLALGVGAPQAAIFHVVTHAFFKACLFLGAGSVIHALHHEQDIRQMGGLLKKLPVTGFAFLISVMAIAGLPPLSGFFSKDEILWKTFSQGPLALYIVGFITAGLTSFYMFRLFAAVFLGKSRGREAHALPFVMKFPVLVLAILAAVAGFMGVPEVLGGHNIFHHWLEYLTAPAAAPHGDHHTTELLLMGASVLLALLTGGFAVKLYSKDINWADSLKVKFRQFYQLVSKKFYVDEIYAAIIIKPLLFLSEKFLWKGVDQKLIDGVVVHSWSDLSMAGSRVLSKLQSGLLAHYLLFLWIGLVALLIYLIGF